MLAAAGCAGGGHDAHAPARSRAVPRPHGTAHPTFLGNTFSSGVAGSVPHSVMELAVSSDGVAVSGSVWEEYNHDARLFASASGSVHGPFTPTRPSGGINGVAIDRRYVYAVSGRTVYRFDRSRWMRPADGGAFDDGSQTGVAPLTVGTRGDGELMGLAECDGALFVSAAGESGGRSDRGEVSPRSARVEVIPTSLAGVTAGWSVPRARTIACDRQGNIWVLQQGVHGGARPSIERFTRDGKLLASFGLPGYPTGLAADPTSNSIVIADNGADQDFKRLSYDGHVIASIGVKGGYLAGPHPGVAGPDRFVGPRAVAIDGAGDLYTAESGLPGAGQRIWTDMGSMAIITKFRPDGRSVVWRDYGLDFGGVGEPSPDASRFYDRHWEYRRDRAGRYRPYAYTVDPLRNPSDDRVGQTGDWEGAATRVIDLDGRRYLTMTDTRAHDLEVYVVRGDIARPVVSFDGNARIVTDGRVARARANPRLPADDGAESYWMDSRGDVWSAGGQDGSGDRIWRYRLQGVARDGALRYDFAHVDRYHVPPPLSLSLRRVEVYGNSIYLSGFSAADPDPDRDWDGWKSLGRHLLKFDSLPTRSGWPRPAWERDLLYGTGPSQMPYPTSFAADPGAGFVAVGWLFGSRTGQGRIDLLSDADGTTEKLLSPPVPSLGKVGWLDLEQSLEAGRGWVWAEDDWQSKIYGICPSGRCS
jgi:DNA-binding beta-propeller fold protein YncE